MGMTSTPVVAAIQTAKVSLPAHPDLVVRGAKGAHDRSDFLLVRVIASNDVEGIGEVSATPLWSGEDGTTADHLIRHVLSPALLGRPLVPVASLDALMDKVLAGNPFTKAGVSIALWDAYARTREISMAEALGGPLRVEIPIKLSLSGDGERLSQVYRAASTKGFRAFKVKVGLGLDGDLARVRLARELAGPDTFLGADANGGWTRSDASKAMETLRAQGIAFLEQPLQPDDLAGSAALRAHGLPIVADESVFGTGDLRRVIEAGAADVVSVYVGKAGGPARAVSLGNVAHAFGLECLIGSNGELGIGAAAQLQVAAAIHGLTTALPSDIIGAHYYAEDVLAEPLPGDGAHVRLPSGPGLGVTLRGDIEARFR